MKEECEETTECCIEGVVVTAELLSAYLRSWARQGVYFEMPQAIRHGGIVGDSPTGRICVVCDDVLTYRFSHRHPDGMKRGKLNGAFLDPSALQRRIFPDRTVSGQWNRVVVFPVAHIYRTEGLSLHGFLNKFVPFLSEIPSERRCAFGVYNSEYLLPAYFDSLREHSVSHVFCTGGTMPGLLDQVSLPYALTADIAVVLSGPSLDVEWQLGMMEIVRRCVDAKKELYVFLDAAMNHQGILPLAVLMERMSGDLAKLSPIRATKAA
jgi:hypothetical protein